MSSTDIDGTPILILGAPDIEYLAELMEGRAVAGQDPTETSSYKKMQHFLRESQVASWLNDFNEKASREMFDRTKAILKAKGVDGYED